ncbi:hypothetical protein [Acinetobacter sp. IK40]|uniref:hypothetical protein n=1 Tax=Acinetobacter sp. IK40 TaxID=2928897 RepID=UPI002D1EA221|nr:hypothetical protein [Acinetobacter sp. IK40]MEB3790134.1 hypothetical protein [Acinetobacter sp. IK40]
MTDLNPDLPVEEGTPVPADQPKADVPAQPVDTPAEPNKDGQPQEPAKQPDLPESADAYKVDLEGFDFDSFKADEGNKAFLENAHAAGISNEQLGVVLQAYEQHTAVQLEQLQTDWGGDYDANLRFAHQAVQAAGLDPKDVDSPTFGIRLAAYYGKALQEDMPPQNTQQSGVSNVSELIASEAYMDSSHPDHKRVYAQVEKHYAKFNQ